MLSRGGVVGVSRTLSMEPRHKRLGVSRVR